MTDTEFMDRWKEYVAFYIAVAPDDAILRRLATPKMCHGALCKENTTNIPNTVLV